MSNFNLKRHTITHNKTKSQTNINNIIDNIPKLKYYLN